MVTNTYFNVFFSTFLYIFFIITFAYILDTTMLRSNNSSFELIWFLLVMGKDATAKHLQILQQTARTIHADQV